MSSEPWESSDMCLSTCKCPETIHSLTYLLNHSRKKKARQFLRGVIRHDAVGMHEDK